MSVLQQLRLAVGMSESTIELSAVDADGLSISDNAARKIAALMSEEDKPGLMMRVAVTGGGCSGFQYAFSFDDTVNGDDLAFEHGGIKVLVDEMSLDFLRGAQLDYVEEMIGASFQIKNPNAASSCGCGSSFAI